MSRLAIIKKTLASKDIKQLIDNFLSLAVLKVFNLILPFITLPYLIKTLGFEKYGAIILALALMQYFQAITDYGFNLSATRDIARHRHSKRQLSFIYSKVMASKVILLCISMSIALPIIFFTPQFQADKTVFLLMLPVLIGHTLFPEWFFRGVEKMRYITILDLFIKLFFTIGVFVFINKPEDYWVYPLLNGIGYLFVSVIAHFLLKNDFSIYYIAVGAKQVKRMLGNSFPLFINQFLPNFYNSTTSFVVGLVLGNYTAGVFGAVRQVLQLVSVFNSVVISVFYPYLIRNKNNFGFFSKWYLISITIIMVFLLISHRILFSILNIDDAVASSVFYYLLAGSWFVVIYSIYSTNYLIINGYYKWVMKITIFSSVSGFLLVYPLVKTYGMIGGGINILISQALMGGLAFFSYLKVTKKMNNRIS